MQNIIDKNLFLELINKFGINNDYQEIENYEKKIQNFKFNTIEIFNKNTNIEIVNKIIRDFESWFNILVYIDKNYSWFKSISTEELAQKITIYGIYNKRNTIVKNFKHKEVMFQISLNQKAYQKKKIIKIDFNLLDKYTIFFKQDYNDNLSSLIYSLDHSYYTNKKIHVHHRKSYRDHLFAIISLENEPFPTCEYNASWLLQTGWWPYFYLINKDLRDFCVENNLEYHFPIHVSKNNLYSMSTINLDNTKKMIETFKRQKNNFKQIEKLNNHLIKQIINIKQKIAIKYIESLLSK